MHERICSLSYLDITQYFLLLGGELFDFTLVLHNFLHACELVLLQKSLSLFFSLYKLVLVLCDRESSFLDLRLNIGKDIFSKDLGEERVSRNRSFAIES